jgi:ERCC4-related helicase
VCCAAITVFMSKTKIKLLSVTEEELEMVIEGLKEVYQRKLKKAQRTANEAGRSPKITEELLTCQTVLQEMEAIANYAKQHKTLKSGIGSSLLY